MESSVEEEIEMNEVGMLLKLMLWQQDNAPPHRKQNMMWGISRLPGLVMV
jgi:hypothetical protein